MVQEWVDGDHVKKFVWSPEFVNERSKEIERRSEESQVSDYWKHKYQLNYKISWDKFYKTTNNKFWKNRAWLFREFDALKDLSLKDSGVFMEVGCGTGSTLFPVMKSCPKISAIGFDCSERAVEEVKRKVDELEIHDNFGGAFLWDATERLPEELRHMEGTADVVTAIFMFSAVPYKLQRQTIDNVSRLLRPDGLLLVRDYGRYDEMELKFIRSTVAKQIEPHLYVRGDDTLQYYWTKEELEKLCQAVGLEVIECHYLLRQFRNRATDVILKRNWVQGVFRKPHMSDEIVQSEERSEQWRQIYNILRPISQFWDSLLGSPKNVVRVINGCLIGLVTVSFSMFGLELSRIEANKDAVISRCDFEIVAGVVATLEQCLFALDLPSPHTISWFRDLHCWLWIGMMVISLGFAFLFNAFISNIDLNGMPDLDEDDTKNKKLD